MEQSETAGSRFTLKRAGDFRQKLGEWWQRRWVRWLIYALAAALPGLAVLPWEHRADALAGHALLVNTTSQGMTGQDPLDMPLDRAAPGLAVSDIVYAPRRTGLLLAAEARGLRQVEGLGMLLHQAVPGFAAWFGVTPVVDRETHDLVTADLM